MGLHPSQTEPLDASDADAHPPAELVDLHERFQWEQALAGGTLDEAAWQAALRELAG